MAVVTLGVPNSMQTSLTAALRRKAAARGFTPWSPPTSPAPGFYDPALGTMQAAADGTLLGFGGQAGQAQRGYDYLYGTTQDQNYRDGSELGFTLESLARSRQRALEAQDRGITRFMQDQDTADVREQQGYDSQTADLGTSYRRLGESQAGNAVQAGLLSGGTFAAALAARQANQQHDQSALDTAHTQFKTDAASARERANADYQTARLATQQDYGDSAHPDDLSAIGQAIRTNGYGISDRMRDLQSAGIENQAYQEDLNDQRWFQAGQAGFAAPARGTPGGQPSNEFADSNGNAYRIVVRGTRRYRQNPDGTETFVGTRPKVKR